MAKKRGPPPVGVAVAPPGAELQPRPVKRQRRIAGGPFDSRPLHERRYVRNGLILCTSCFARSRGESVSGSTRLCYAFTLKMRTDLDIVNRMLLETARRRLSGGGGMEYISLKDLETRTRRSPSNTEVLEAVVMDRKEVGRDGSIHPLSSARKLALQHMAISILS